MSVVIVCCQLSINMRKTLKFILWITILLFGAGLYSMNTDFLAYEMSLPDTEQPVVPDDEKFLAAEAQRRPQQLQSRDEKKGNETGQIGRAHV